MLTPAPVPTSHVGETGDVVGELHPLWPWREGAKLQVHDGREHFEKRRDALTKLEAASNAIDELIKLGGYPQRRLIEAGAAVSGAQRVIAGSLPVGDMPRIAALLSDRCTNGPKRRPLYPTWLDAEQTALERVAPDADHNALAEADGRGRTPDAFRKKRERR